jgi:hypothetical protein
MDTLVATSPVDDTQAEKKVYDSSPLSLDSLYCTNDDISTPEALSPSAVVPTLQSLQSLQNTSDTAQDMADLRSLMKTALQKTSDVEMMEVLQVGREEMPEAIRTLQRAFECVVEKEVAVGDIWGDGSVNLGEFGGSGWGEDSKHLGMGFSVELSGSARSGWRMDMLDRELMETGLDALRRMSKRPGMAKVSPDWCTPR